MKKSLLFLPMLMATGVLLSGGGKQSAEDLKKIEDRKIVLDGARKFLHALNIILPPWDTIDSRTHRLAGISQKIHDTLTKQVDTPLTVDTDRGYVDKTPNVADVDYKALSSVLRLLRDLYVEAKEQDVSKEGLDSIAGATNRFRDVIPVEPLDSQDYILSGLSSEEEPSQMEALD